jgi:acetyltransferase-like isoleucine patch superfamily enzyme
LLWLNASISQPSSESIVNKLFDACLQLASFIREGWFAVVRHNESKLAGRFRRNALRTGCLSATGVVVTDAENFECGDHCALYHGTYILNPFGKFRLGNDSHLGARCFVNVCYGSIQIGDHVAIGPHTSLIAYSNHYEKGTFVTEGRIQEDIVIGNNVFVGAHCTVLPGSIIHDNVVIGAGSIIKGELESNAVYAGAPCRKIRDGWYE